MKIILFATFVAACQALTPLPITGTTPPAVQCPDSLCHHKYDGNYEYHYYGIYNPHYFLQCSNSEASCQACWPLALEFSVGCNQCLPSRTSDCVITLPFHPATTFECPDKCPHRGAHFSGNIADPNNAHHYVACFHGATVGCVACPKGLLYNEKWNACLYNGIHKTEPSPHAAETTRASAKSNRGRFGK